MFFFDLKHPNFHIETIPAIRSFVKNLEIVKIILAVVGAKNIIFIVSR
jgi:hypothetical protein